MSNKKVEEVLEAAKKALSSQKLDAIKDALTKVQDLSTGSGELSHEEYEDRIEAVIADLVESLRRANEIEEAREEKKIEVDANDNHIVSTEDENESDLVPTTVKLPIPSGIPDHAKDLTSVDLINSRYPGPDYARGAEAASTVLPNDKGPFISQYAYSIKHGDFVSWEAKANKSFGIVKEIVTDGDVAIPDSPLRLLAQSEDPVFICNILRNDHKGWLLSPDTLPVKGSQLTLENALKDSIGDYLDLSRANVAAKKLNIKFTSDDKFQSSADLYIRKKTEQDYRPNEAQLAKINRFTLKDLTVDEAYTFELVAADSEIDRGDEQFLPPALVRLSQLYPGNPWLRDHNWESGDIIGTIYDGRVENGLLILDGFIPKTADNQEIIDNLLMGKWRKLSVGFEAGANDMLCSACNKSMLDMRCPHEKGEILPSGHQVTLQYKDVSDVFEVSTVAVPMQAGAHVRRSKNNQIEFTPGISPAEEEQESLENKTEPGDKNNKSLTLDTIPSVNNSKTGIKTLMDEEKKEEKMVMEVPGEKKAEDENGTEVKAEDKKPEDDKVEKAGDEDEAKTKLSEQHSPFASDFKGMHDKMDALHAKCDALHAKCADIHQFLTGESNFKAMPSEVPGEKKEGLSEEEMGLKALIEAVKELKAQNEQIQKQLNVAMSVSGTAMKSLLLAEVEEKVEPTKVSKSVTRTNWLADGTFTVPSKDSGGQK